jgi:hypothetical protein
MLPPSGGRQQRGDGARMLQCTTGVLSILGRALPEGNACRAPPE